MKPVSGRVAPLALAVLACLPLVSFLTAARADSVPYTDAHATGYVGLCDQNGNPVTHGSINDRPFVWLSVSSSPAALDFNVPGKTATLFGFQPVQGEDPGRWEGSQMTAGSWYTNGAHPMVAATSDAASLADVLGNYPTKWDGLVQLRIYVGAPGIGIHGQTYPATDIKVSGTNWTVVRGGIPDCRAGYAVSVNTGPKPTSSATVSPGAPGGTGAAGSGSTSSGSASQGAGSGSGSQASNGTGTGTANSTGGPTGGSAGANAAAKRSTGEGGGGSGLAIAAIIAAVVLLAGVAFLVVKYRQGGVGKLPEP